MSANVRVFSVLSWVVLVVASLLGTPIARADCLPIAYTRYVGNTATDTLCTENDIQSAINNSVCPTTIYVSNERAWTAQHLDIDNKNLTIVGRSGGCGTQTCDGGCTVPTAPVVTISGSGHSGDSVMYIHGTSNITLKYLDIRNGNNINGAANTYGGGIHFDGKGSLVLDTTWVRNNVARYGGGINMSGTSGFAGLTVLGGTRIENNQAANDGGGIRITDNTFMSILYDHTLIWLNQALNGYGGGIQVKGPAHADIGSPGESGLGVIYSNTAKYGGGLAVTAGSNNGEDANLQIFTVDPVRPVRIQGNSASTSGGAVYMKPYASFPTFNNASLCAFDFRIDDNAAPEGSAIQLDSDSSVVHDNYSFAGLNSADKSCSAPPAAARRCTTGVPCNEFVGNDAVDAGATPTPGATIRITDNSILDGNRFSMRGNRGGYAIRSGNLMLISNCLIAGNDVSLQLLRGDSGDFTIENCTLVENAILSTNAIYSAGPLSLFRTIIDQPGNNALGFGGDASDLHVNYVLSSDVSTLPQRVTVVEGRPTYVDAGSGNYRLAPYSLGVDFATDDTYLVDLDNFPRRVDLPSVANLFGPRDLGAYERPTIFDCGAADTVFCDGFNN